VVNRNMTTSACSKGIVIDNMCWNESLWSCPSAR